MSEPAIFDGSLFDRIAQCLPTEQRTAYYRYVAHLRNLDPKDELLLLAMGIGFFTTVAQQVPASVAAEREKLLVEFALLCRKHEAATSGATADCRTMFAAHQKLIEQNMGQWQNREQKTVEDLGRAVSQFEKSVERQVQRLTEVITDLTASTKEHRTVALKAQQCLNWLNWRQLLWPCVACAASGALVVFLLLHIWPH
ncbi:MAG: hypothetical protein F9K30_23180 [Dechloromonas sp.]|nr:MAG: hypothetical protein F9K30_23180 [Dechloromonas sp.]